MKSKALFLLLSLLSMLVTTSTNAATIDYSWNGTVFGNDTDGSVFVSLTWDAGVITGGTAFVNGFDIYTSATLDLFTTGDTSIDFMNPAPGTDDITYLALYGIFYNLSPVDYTFDNRTHLNTNAFGGPSFDINMDVNSLLINGLPATVPVPAAAWLFGSGLIGLLGVARRKKA